MAYAGASVDGRNQGQKSLNVDVPEESLGMARLTDALPATFFSTTGHKSGRHLMTLVGTQRGWHHFLGRTPTIDGTIALVGMQAYSSYMRALGTAGRHCILREIVRMTRGCQRELIQVARSSGVGVNGVDGAPERLSQRCLWPCLHEMPV